MGLSFSVPQGIKVPPSLVNIYKEIQADVGCSIPSHGNLEKWAYQVLANLGSYSKFNLNPVYT
jgi:uracil-DNA glycosylase